MTVGRYLVTRKSCKAHPSHKNTVVRKEVYPAYISVTNGPESGKQYKCHGSHYSIFNRLKKAKTRGYHEAEVCDALSLLCVRLSRVRTACRRGVPGLQLYPG